MDAVLLDTCVLLKSYLCDTLLSIAEVGTFRPLWSDHVLERRSDVLALASRALTREQEQSRWLHAAIAGRLVAEPDLVLARARANLDRFSAVHAGTMAAHWLGLWRDALDAGPDQILTALVSETPQAAEMRQNSPFSGILPPDERRAVLESFQRHWLAGHAR
jgi:hypothetical protein